MLGKETTSLGSSKRLGLCFKLLRLVQPFQCVGCLGNLIQFTLAKVSLHLNLMCNKDLANQQTLLVLVLGEKNPAIRSMSYI